MVITGSGLLPEPRAIPDKFAPVAPCVHVMAVFGRLLVKVTAVLAVFSHNV